MTELRCGDLVRLTRDANGRTLKAGIIGTVLENSSDGVPWVEFEAPTDWPFSIRMEDVDDKSQEYWKGRGKTDTVGKKGYCDSVCEDYLELVQRTIFVAPENREAVLREALSMVAEECRDKAHVWECRGHDALAKYWTELSEKVTWALAVTM